MPDFGTYRPTAGLGYAQITGLSAAKALSASAPDGSTVAIVQVESQDVRWRDDNTAPTASVGMVLRAGEIIEFSCQQFATVKFIEMTASAKLNCSFY